MGAGAGAGSVTAGGATGSGSMIGADSTGWVATTGSSSSGTATGSAIGFATGFATGGESGSCEMTRSGSGVPTRGVGSGRSTSGGGSITAGVEITGAGALGSSGAARRLDEPTSGLEAISSTLSGRADRSAAASATRTIGAWRARRSARPRRARPA
ncbi:MAG: hypothetical protein FJW96_13150 [Actinobacteria bacterium]|nr:hypothetical protein [Actinomycetota bacterium]